MVATEQTVCYAHKHHSWFEIQRHHVQPLAIGGPDTEANIVRACANAHRAAHWVMYGYVRFGGPPPWEPVGTWPGLKHFGAAERALGKRGIDAWLASGGTYGSIVPEKLL
jgi:HNH endonuclease